METTSDNTAIVEAVTDQLETAQIPYLLVIYTPADKGFDINTGATFPIHVEVEGAIKTALDEQRAAYISREFKAGDKVSVHELGKPHWTGRVYEKRANDTYGVELLDGSTGYTVAASDLSLIGKGELIRPDPNQKRVEVGEGTR